MSYQRKEQIDRCLYDLDWVHLVPKEQIGQHKQSMWELSYVATGAGIRSIGDTSESFTSGEVILIPPEIPHCWYFDEKTTDSEGMIENATLIFKTALIERCAAAFPELEAGLNRLKKRSEAVKFTSVQAARIIGRLTAMHTESLVERTASLTALMALLAEEDEVMAVGNRNKIDRQRRRMNQVHTYVVCNYDRRITLDDMAHHVGMNRASFCIFFKRATGNTFVSYLNAYRIDMACRLLADVDLTVSDVCYKTGFNNISHFNHVFVKLIGVPPSRYAACSTRN